MTLEEAYIVLRRFEDWRIGADCRLLGDAFPEEVKDDLSNTPVDQAFRLVLAAQGLGKPIADCHNCRHYDNACCNLDVKGECKAFEEKQEVASCLV